MSKAILEVSKYCTKPSDLSRAGRSWLIPLALASHKRRFLEIGGEFRKYFKVSEGNEDLINVEGEKNFSSNSTLPKLDFNFSKEHMRYIHR